MAPIHDTDIASDRWARAEWEHYELWEKIELKLRHRRWLSIGVTTLIFFALSSWPIVQDRAPHWTALALTRKLAQEVNTLKRDAAIRHEAYRIRFAGHGSLEYRIESVKNCTDMGAGGTIRTSALLALPNARDFVMLSPADGAELGIPGLLETFCYDSLIGSEIDAKGEALAGFGVMSAQDLVDHRMDRVAVLLIHGPAGELAFE